MISRGWKIPYPDVILGEKMATTRKRLFPCGWQPQGKVYFPLAAYGNPKEKFISPLLPMATPRKSLFPPCCLWQPQGKGYFPLAAYLSPSLAKNNFLCEKLLYFHLI